MALIENATFDSLRETLGLRKQTPSYTQTSGGRNADPQIIQIPKSFFPHADFQDALWIVIKARKLKNINTKGRGGAISISEHGDTWKFLAPEELVEVHNHGWEPYDSFHSRLLEKIRALHVGVEQFEKITKASIDEAKKLWTEKNTNNLLSKLEAGVINASNTDLPQYKIDTPLIYQSSERRTWDLNFTLASSNGGTDILDAVKRLQKAAAPNLIGDSETTIEFPYIFEVRTEPSDMIKFGFAIINTIQPTWKGPFRYGNPFQCELQIGFTDMSPLFRKTIEEGTIITVAEDPTQTTFTTNTPYKKDPQYDGYTIAKPPDYVNQGRGDF